MVVAIVVVVVVVGSMSSSGKGGSTSSTTTNIAEAISRLRALLPSDAANCRYGGGELSSGEAFSGSLAEAWCDYPPGLDGIQYYLFPDRATQDSSFKNVKGLVQCPGRGPPQPWHRAATPQQTEGRAMIRTCG